MGPPPEAVAAIDDATAVATGGSHTCVVVTSGAVRCWGSNGEGETGWESGFPTTPEAVDEPTAVVRDGHRRSS